MVRGWWLSVFVVVAGCPGIDTPPASKCEGVRCTGTDTCDPATGLCRSSVDGGRDAGTTDAGRDGGSIDAGLPDAGPDGGRPLDGGVDAGIDAGLDAGSEFDAGQPECLIDADCFGVRNRCEPILQRCVECFDDQHCPSAIPKCELVTHACVECLSNVDCQNPLPTCRNRVCDDCLTLGECGAGRVCELRFGDCTNLPDSCAAPQPLAIPDAGGTQYVRVDLSTAVDDLTTSCSTGPDLVYSLDLGQPRDVIITARLVGQGTAVPSVALRQAPCGSGVEVACDRPGDGGSAASIALSNVAAGSYVVVLEAPAGTSGTIELGVSALPAPTTAANDTCAGEEPLAFFGTRAVTVGSTVLGTNDALGPTCSPTANATGRDLVYGYDVDAGSNVTVTVRPLAGSTLVPVVSVRPACASASNELACTAATGVGETRTASITNQPPGHYAVIVDSAAGSSGSFQLEVTKTPIVPNDGCTGIQPLVFSGSTAAATGDTSFAANDNAPGDATPSCSASARASGSDVVFSYTLTTARDVTVSVTPTGASPTFWPVLSVRSSCANAATAGELACVSPNSTVQARATLVNQPAGNYVVWVDGAAQTAGPFQLEVVTAPATPPPANDSCQSPQPLTFTQDVATVTGSTLQAANDNFAFDVSPTCSTTAKQNGRDVVYSFTLTAPRDVTLSVAPTAGSLLRPVLYVRKAMCLSQLLGDELVCLERVGPATAVLTNLAAGTYFVFVDGAGGSSGNFSLTATLAAPTTPPANDDCAGALALPFVNDVATTSATTFGATNSNVSIDNAPACGTDFIPRRWGRDLVYSFTTTAPKDVEVRAVSTSGSALVPVTYVRTVGSCALGFAGNELACGAATVPGAAIVYLPNLPAGTYPLFVDSNSYDTGGFTLQVRQLPPTLPPSNDACSSPTPIALGPIGVQADTTGARDDYSIASNPRYAAACGNWFFSGRDVVFSFSPPTSGVFTATVTPQDAFDPALLQLNGSCSAAQCVRASDLAGAGGAEAIAFSATQGQPVYFVVDSADSSAPSGFGAFTITVQ